MKKSVRKLVLISALIVSACLYAEAQSVSYTIRNEVQTSDRTLEFDLFLLNTETSIPIQIAEFQAGIYVNPDIENGGTISASIVPGASDMKRSQQPTAITYASNCVKIATRMYLGCGNATVISTSAPGTKLCRVRLTNSVAFASQKANLGFNFLARPYASRLFYYNSNCVSTQLVTDSTNCFNLTSNPVLNYSFSTTTNSNNKIKSTCVSSELSMADPKVFVASGKLTIDLSACDNDAYSAYLLDVNGHSVWCKSLSGGESYSYGLPGRGMYLVNLVSSGGQKVYKIVF
ncbi:MAG: hypothetical protein P4L28_07585 [Paludibacteraceae bacterium]|nr:hypothetical protein [Paludibacteraceae bacterium]